MRKIGILGVVAAFALLLTTTEASARGCRGGRGHRGGCGGGGYATSSCGGQWQTFQQGGCSDCAGGSTYGGINQPTFGTTTFNQPYQTWQQPGFQQPGFQQPGIIVQGDQQPGTVTTTGPVQQMPQNFGQKGTLWITGDDGRLKQVPADYYDKLNLKKPQQP